MEKQIPLKYFAYAITPSAVALAVVDSTDGHQFATHLPLVDIKFDFENGNFTLEGDWHFLMASNRHVEQSWYACHRERVKIDASICPSTIINLADQRNDGSGFALQGTISDGNNLSSCFGLLLLENTGYFGKLPGNEWSLTFYLYDTLNNECEIRMKLPLYVNSTTLAS